MHTCMLMLTYGRLEKSHCSFLGLTFCHLPEITVMAESILCPCFKCEDAEDLKKKGKGRNGGGYGENREAWEQGGHRIEIRK